MGCFEDYMQFRDEVDEVKKRRMPEEDLEEGKSARLKSKSEER